MAQRHKKIEPRRIRPDADVANSAGKKKMKRKKNNIEGASCRTWTVRIIGVSSMTRRTTHGCREERRIRVRPKKGERITHPRIPTRDNACHIETIPATAVSIWPKNGFWSARRNFRMWVFFRNQKKSWILAVSIEWWYKMPILVRDAFFPANWILTCNKNKTKSGQNSKAIPIWLIDRRSSSIRILRWLTAIKWNYALIRAVNSEFIS